MRTPDAYKYTGHERDKETGINIDYMLARGYDPTLARFLQVDPMLEYSSPYVYVGNNPVNLIDPTGMFSCNDGESRDECNQRYAQEAQAEWDAIDAGASASDVWGANSILNRISSNIESPQSKKPNWHQIDNSARGQAIVDYLLYLAENDLRNGDLNDIFDFYDERIGKVNGPSAESGVYEFIAKTSFGSFDGHVQFFISATTNRVNFPDYTKFNIEQNGPGYANLPKPNHLQNKIDQYGNAIRNKDGRQILKQYRFMQLQSTPHAFAIKMRVITGSEQNFYNSLVRKLRNIKSK